MSKDEKGDEGKSGSKYDEDEIEFGAKGGYEPTPPTITVSSVEIDPVQSGLSEPFNLKIKFELDRDCIAASWIIKFLVDSGHKRVIKVFSFLRRQSYLVICLLLDYWRDSS